MLIVITGNPGVGKHTVTVKVAKKLDLPIIDINNMARDSGLFERDNDDSTNNVDTAKLGKILKEKISKKCIIVGHLAPYILDKDQVKIAIVIRRSPYELITVYKERGYTKKKSKENAESEVLGIIAHDAMDKFQEKTFQINSSGKTIQEITDKAVALISGTNNGDKVDWLGLITKNNDLEKFFAD